MIDFLKILILNKKLIDDLHSNQLLSNYSIVEKFKNNLNKEVQEITQAKITKVYKEIIFCFYTKGGELTKLEVLFKPHYYFNSNLHNVNDFSALDCIETLTEIRDVFKLPVDELFILNIEFGVNAISPIDCKKLITHTIYHNKNLFISSSDSLGYSRISFKQNRNGRANNYKKIKFYHKGLQFPKYTDKNTFRFEIKSKRSNYIKNKINVFSYGDLLKTKTYHLLSQVIKNEFTKVLMLDVYNTCEGLTPNETKKIKEYNNPFKWSNALEGSKNTFNNNKKAYYKLLDKTGSNIHNAVVEIINTKLAFLLKNCANLTALDKTENCANLNVYIIEKGTTKPNRICPVTGIDISMQKGSSYLLSHSGLKHLYKTSKEKFDEVRRKHLTSKWWDADFNTQIREIAHNIRDTMKNRRLKQDRLYPTYQKQLFLL